MNLHPWSHRPATEPDLVLRGWSMPPSGKPLLHVLHGNGLCARAYEPMLRHLADDFDLWLCDVQGHGDSDPGAHFLGWNRNAQAALSVFAAQRARYGDVPVHALGHSFGGVLTALIAATPGQPFDRLVLLDPVLFPPAMLLALRATIALGWVRHTPLSKAAARRRAVWPDRAAAVAGLRGRGAYKGWDDDALQAFVTHGLRDVPGGVGLKCSPQLESEIFGSCPQRLWPAVRAIDRPTLVVHGDRTMPFVARAARRASAVNRHVAVREVPGGHCFMQEDPRAAADVVRAFLAA